MAEREDAVQGAWEMKKSKWESRLKMVEKVTEQMELTHRVVSGEMSGFLSSEMSGFLSSEMSGSDQESVVAGGDQREVICD